MNDFDKQYSKNDVITNTREAVRVGCKAERERIKAMLREKIEREKEHMGKGAVDVKHSGGKIAAWGEMLLTLEAEDDAEDNKKAGPAARD